MNKQLIQMMLNTGKQLDAEMNMLIENDTWELTPLPPTRTETRGKCCKRYGQIGIPAPVYSHWIGLEEESGCTLSNKENQQ